MDRFMRKCVMDRKIVQFIIEKKSFNKISKTLNVGKKRIARVRKLAEEAGYLKGRPLPPPPESIFDYGDFPGMPGRVSDTDSVILPHKDWIRERREAGWHLITIWEELPVKVNRSSFYRFIERHRLNDNRERGRCRVKVVSEIIHPPGDALILDWGKMMDITEGCGKKRTLWFLAGVMGHSRHMAVRLVWDNKTETTIDALEGMFREIGGIPKKLISDNPKCFSVLASKYEPILNPAFERFCAYYGTIPEILPPREPKKKGKVERIVPYVRRLFEAHGEDWNGIEKAQKYLDEKIKLANERRHGTTGLRPVDGLVGDELPLLGELPATAFEREEYHQGKVRRDGCVHFRGKYYSVGKEYCTKEVFVIGGGKTIKIYHRGKLLETHDRITSHYRSKSIKPHHLEPHERIISNSKHYLNQAAKIGPETKELIEAILLSGNGFIDTRKVWGILSLDKNHDKGEIEKACRYALDCGRPGYRAVVTFLNATPASKEEIPKPDTSKQNKFTRQMDEYTH